MSAVTRSERENDLHLRIADLERQIKRMRYRIAGWADAVDDLKPCLRSYKWKVDALAKRMRAALGGGEGE